MSFASITLREREKESKALRIFLTCSLAGSLIFHLALLASGIGKYLLNRVPEVDSEPVEITLLDTPIEEIEPEPKEEIKPKPKPEPKLEKPEPKPEIKQPVIDTTKIQPNLDTTPSESRISGGSPALSNFRPIPTQPRVAPQPPPVAKPLPQPDFKPFKEFKPIKPVSPVLPSAPLVAVREKPVIPQQKPEPKPEPIAKNEILEPIPQPEVRTPREFSTAVEPPQATQDSSQELKDLLAQERDSRRTPREFETPITPPVEQTKPNEDLKDLLAQERDSRTPREFSTPVNPPIEPPAAQPNEDLKDLLAQERDSRRTARTFSTAVEPPSTSTPDTSNSGRSNDNAPRRRRRSFDGNVASAPNNTTDTGGGNGLGSGTGDSVGDADGRAACRRCSRSYPSWARQRGIEGSITVSVNADASGNVTDVQLISGSGNSRLDNHHIKLARKWKLKPSSNGRQGVTIITQYQLQ